MEDWEEVVPQALVPVWPASDLDGSWLYLGGRGGVG